MVNNKKCYHISNNTALWTLTLFVPTNFPIKFDTVTSGRSIINIEGLQAIIFRKNNVLRSLKIYLVLAYSADPDEMPHNAAFHLGLHCLSRSLVFKGLNHILQY